MIGVKLETLTPVLIGGYDTLAKRAIGSYTIVETLRPTSIKGVWRWWARAAVAGSAFRNAGKFAYITDLDELVSRIFGSVRSPSKFSFSVYPEDEDYLCDAADNLRGIPNPRFMRFRARNYYVIKEGSKFTLKIHDEKLNDDEREFVLDTLALSLFLDGVGKATSRGFGKLKIIDVEPADFDFVKYDGGTKNYVVNLINRALEKAGKIFNFDFEGLGDGPYVETLVPPDGDPHLFYLEVVENPEGDVWQTLRRISIAVLKVTEKIYREGGESRNDAAWKNALKEPGYKYDTWILGLPRSQEPALSRRKLYDIFVRNVEDQRLRKNLKKLFREVGSRRNSKYTVPTGYYIFRREGDLKGRRRSPIRFSIVSNEIIIFAFYTKDLENLDPNFRHVGYNLCDRANPFRVNRISIRDKLKDVLEEKLSFLKEVLGKPAFLDDVHEFLEKIRREGSYWECSN